MPYVISPPITLNSTGEWFEGTAYEKKNIYSIEEDKLPPVNYDVHTLKPHSLTHIETPKHLTKNAHGIDYYFQKRPKIFYGRAIVVKFENSNWKELSNGVKHKIIELNELKEKLKPFQKIERVLISIDNIPENEHGHHDPNYIVTLSLEAAQFLTSHKEFKLFGTTWKSTDYMPGSPERPIHKEIFKKALILEYINLNKVLEGEYFINCFPLNLEGASETPVTAVLFNKDELKYE